MNLSVGDGVGAGGLHVLVGGLGVGQLSLGLRNQLLEPWGVCVCVWGGGKAKTLSKYPGTGQRKKKMCTVKAAVSHTRTRSHNTKVKRAPRATHQSQRDLAFSLLSASSCSLACAEASLAATTSWSISCSLSEEGKEKETRGKATPRGTGVHHPRMNSCASSCPLPSLSNSRKSDAEPWAPSLHTRTRSGRRPGRRPHWAARRQRARRAGG